MSLDASIDHLFSVTVFFFRGSAAALGDDQDGEGEGDRREVGRLAVWSCSSAKPGNGVELLRDGRTDTFWQLSQWHHLYVFLITFFKSNASISSMKFSSNLLAAANCRSDGSQPHLVNIQFQKKVRLQVHHWRYFPSISGVSIELFEVYGVVETREVLSTPYQWSVAGTVNAHKVPTAWYKGLKKALCGAANIFIPRLQT